MAFRSRNPECSLTQAADVSKPKTHPKRIPDEAVKNVTPQDIQENVANVELLSTSIDHKAPAAPLEEKDGGRSSMVESPEEVIESAVSYQVESGLSSEPDFSDEAGLHPFLENSIALKSNRARDEPGSFSEDLEKEVKFEKESMKQPCYPTEKVEETEGEGRDKVEQLGDSETEAILKPSTECRSSSVDSVCQPVESLYTQEMTSDAAGERREEVMEVEDKLYPDGEEMDTWDSVIERKVDEKTDEEQKHEEKIQHAEPEEDISAKETKHAMKEISQDPNVASLQVNDSQHGSLDQDHAPPSENDGEDDDEEDSQNVSVSWRTELEGDSYAQDNTLADTRPLIRYKSDETDAHTQASHLDESESSDGEQERKTGEAGTWSEGKSKTFGTMEDLCEEVEDESVDDQYNPEDRDESQSTVVNEQAEVANLEDEDGSARNVEKTEELTATKGLKLEEEELEMDILVDEELENLSSNTNFLQWQVSEENQDLSLNNEQKESEKPIPEHPEHTSPSTTEDQASETAMLNGSSVEEHDVEPKNKEAEEKPAGHGQEMEQNLFSLMCADGKKDHSAFGAFSISSDVDKTVESEDPKSAVAFTEDEIEIQDVVRNEVTEVLPGEKSQKPQEDEDEGEESHMFPENAEAAEWEILDDPTYDYKIEDHDRTFTDQESADYNPESHEDAAEKVEEETDIFIVSAPSDNKPPDFFSSGVKNDFWVSSLEGGAAYDDTCEEAEEQGDQNQGFAEPPNVVNGHSMVVADSSKPLAAVKDQTEVSVEAKKVCQRYFEGEMIHSEDSENEAESWSSGDEAAAERNPFLDTTY